MISTVTLWGVQKPMPKRISPELRSKICDVWEKNPDLSLQDAARRFGLAAGATIGRIVAHLPPHKRSAEIVAGRKTKME